MEGLGFETSLGVLSKQNLQNLDEDNAKEHAEQLNTWFREHIDPTKLEDCLDLLFDVENGIGSFLTEKLCVSKYNASKEQILLLLRFIVTHEGRGPAFKEWKNIVFRYCRLIMEPMKKYWINSREPAKHQQLALDCIIAILDNYDDDLDEGEFGLGSLYWELLVATEKSSFQPTVRAKMFHALGLIGVCTRETFFKKDGILEKLVRHIMIQIKDQVESTDTKLEVAILHGCLKAMDKLLQHFHSQIGNIDGLWAKFYENLRQIVDPKCSIATDSSNMYKLKRREFQRVGLELINHNAALFNKDMFKHYQTWYTDLLSWSQSNNASDSTAGRYAMFSYLRAVIQYVSSQDDLMTLDEMNKFVEFFLHKFEEILSSETPRRNEVIVAITGAGLLSPLCSSPSQMARVSDLIFVNVGAIITELRNPAREKYSGSLTLVPTYLEALGPVLVSTKDMSDDSKETNFMKKLNAVEEFAVLWLTMYPQLTTEHYKRTAHMCLLKLIHSFQLKLPDLCIPFVDRVLKTSLTQIIASPTAAELEIVNEAWRAEMEIKNQGSVDARPKRGLGLQGVAAYLQFWLRVCNSSTEPLASKIVYDRILSWSLITIEKMNLSINVNPDEDTTDEIQIGGIFSSMKAEKPKDFQLFVNLTEFIQSILSNSPISFFENWILEFVSTVMNYPSQYPLVSGFYKILGETLKITGKLQFFQKPTEDSKTLLAQCSDCMKSILQRIDTFRDDLLLSVLELWLSVPDEVLLLNISNWGSTLEKIFKIGRSNFKLADASIDAIQRWISTHSVPRGAIEDIVIRLFPIWQTYFISKSEAVAPEPKSAVISVRKGLTKQRKSQRNQPKVEDDLAAQDEVLSRVQLKLLQVIGSFGHLISFPDSENLQALEENYEILKFSVPLGAVSPDLYLDSIIPRVLSLCENSANRQVRTTAGEFLHTTMLYFLGFSVRSSGSQTVSLFKKVFEATVKLSGDTDYLIRQLFNPLASQCIHWFTKQKSSYSDVILELLVDGLVSEEEQLKDFCADSVFEFFKWALRYDNKKLAADVIQYIMVLSTHANERFRIGSSIAFNSIYSDFREYTELSSMYTIELLTGFLTSLAVSRNASEDSVIIQSTKLSIDHLERIIIKKKDIFNINMGNRKRPLGFKGDTVCLNDLAKWLFLQVGHPSRLYNMECKRILCVIVLLVKGVSNLDEFWKSLALEDKSSIIVSAETKTRLQTPEDLVTFLEPAASSYAFLASITSTDLKAIVHLPNSSFLSAVHALLIIEEDATLQLESFYRICLNLKSVQHLLDPIDRDLMCQAILKVSKKLTKESEITKMLDILMSLDLNQEILQAVEQDFNSTNVQNLLASNSLDKIRWFRLACEKKLFTKLESCDAASIMKISWTELVEQMFGKSNEKSQTQTNEQGLSITLSKLTKFEELFRISLVLGIPSDSVFEVAFSPDIVNPSDPTKPDKGKIFQHYLTKAMLHPSLMNFSDLLSKVKIDKVANYIESLLEISKTRKFVEPAYRKILFDRVIEVWRTLAVNCDRFCVGRILAGLTSLDIQNVKDSKELCNWWCGWEVMTSPVLELREKVDFIGFLQLFSTSNCPTNVDAVGNAMHKLLSELPTLQPSDSVEPYSRLVLQFMAIVEKTPKNTRLFRLLCSAVAKLSTSYSHPDVGSLHKNVSRRILTLSQSQESSVSFSLASLSLDHIQSTSGTNGALDVYKHVLRPLLMGMAELNLKKYFKDRIGTIMQILGSPVVQDKFYMPTIAYSMLAMMSKRTSPAFYDELTAIYESQQEGNSRKSILKVTSETFMAIKKKKMDFSVENKIDANIKFHSAAYNALASMLMIFEKPNQQQLIEAFLIHEDQKKAFLWENLVDCSINIQDLFPVLLQSETISSNPEIDESADQTKEAFSSRIIQMAKTRFNLAESSLAVASGAFDFTGSLTINESAFYQKIFPKRFDGQPSGLAGRPQALPYNSVAFDRECLEGLVAAIKKLSVLSETSKSENWIRLLKEALESSQNCNIKIFILVAFLNCQNELKPYAKLLVDSICKLVLGEFWNEPFNYFVKEVLVMILEWSEIAQPTSQNCGRILTHVIEQTEMQEQKYSRNDLLDGNMKILDAVIRCWKLDTIKVDIPASLLSDLMKKENPKVGLGACKYFMKNGILPIPDPQSYTKSLAKLLHNSSRSVYALAAECVGLLLMILKNRNYSHTSKVVDYIKEKLIGEKERHSAFTVMVMIKQIQLNWPEVTALFKEQLLMLFNVSTVSNLAVVEVLFDSLSSELSTSSTPTELVTHFIRDASGRNAFKEPCRTEKEVEVVVRIMEVFLRHRNGELDTIFLNLANFCLKDLQTGSFDNVTLKVRYFQCLSDYFYLKQADGVEDNEVLHVFITALDNESSPEVQKIIEDFWSNFLRQINHPKDLLFQLVEFSKDYPNGLNIILSRVLQRSSLSAEFGKTVFDKPLEDCVFHKYTLDTSWRMKQASFLPLFAESLSTQNFATMPEAVQSSILRQRRSTAQFGASLLRATLSSKLKQFSSTAAMEQTGTSAGMEMDFADLFAGVSSDGLAESPNFPVVPQGPLAELKKKYYNRPRGDSEFFSSWQSRVSASKRQNQTEKLRARHNMRLSRHYRIGDIPDIMITHSDLLTTLIKLCQADKECGRAFLSQIFSTLLTTPEDILRAEESFPNILAAKTLSSTFAATVIDISIRCQVYLPPEQVTTVCKTHKLHDIGIVSLEQRLREGDAKENPSPAKRRRMANSILSSLPQSEFLYLAELYQDLEETDVLKNIFLLLSKHSHVYSKNFSSTVKALGLEASGGWEDACAIYSKLFDSLCTNKESDSFTNFIETAYAQCLASLSDWDDLSKLQEKSTNSESPPSRVLMLSTRAKFMKCLEDSSEKDGEEEMPTISEELPFLVERAFLHACLDTNTSAQSSFYLNKFYSEEVSKFANFPRLPAYQRSQLILQMQLASALGDFIEWHNNLSEDNVLSKTMAILSKSEKLIQNNMAPLLSSAAVTSARTFFLNKLRHHELLVDNEDLSQNLSRLNFQQHLWMLSLSMRDRVQPVALKFLESSKALGEDVLATDFFAWRKLYPQFLGTFKTAYKDDDDCQELFTMWGSAWKKVRNGSSNSSSLSQEAGCEEDLAGIKANLLGVLMHFVPLTQGSNPFAKVNLALGVHKKTILRDAFQTATAQLLDQLKNTVMETGLNCGTSLEIYEFMEGLMRCCPEMYQEPSTHNLLLKTMLHAMANEDKQSSLLVPRLLDLLQSEEDVHECFSENIGVVPSWKFLPWLDQFLTLSSGNVVIGQILKPVLKELQQQFPDAFLFRCNLPATGSETYCRFVKCLQTLVLPTILHKDMLRQVDNLPPDQSKIREIMIAIRDIMQEVQNDTETFGPLHTMFAQEMLEVLGSYAVLMDEDQIMEDSSVIQDSLKGLKARVKSLVSSHDKKVFPDQNRSTRVKDLKEFSPWLSKFHHAQSNETIRIPGLFDHFVKLDVETHPSIMSFNPTVNVYNSLTIPVRFTILGNDGKRRNFLAKYGDDLRQDRRIQQLFRTANETFSKHSQTRSRCISITSYSVIPITEKFGIIEWLDNTMKLSSFILNTKELEAKQQDTAIARHRGWLVITAGHSATSLVKCFALSAKKASRKDAEKHFDIMTQITSPTLLNDNLMKMCKSLEQFFHVRQNFIRSYAAMCLVHWLLGIGDRHLENSLISFSSGKIIGIDFGRAFEAANYTFPIPEMIPFRLSPNFVNLMMPYDCKGLFKETMCLSWNCLLSWKETILFIVKSFVQERDIDWKKGRTTKISVPTADTESLNTSGLIEVMRRKLDCEDPVQILLDILKSNPSKVDSQPIATIYCDIVKSGRSIETSRNILSSEKVMERLIDLATDKNILARVYFGLLPWV